MDVVPIDQLQLLDLHGRRVALRDYVGDLSLLIFLRHLA
jgi:hypothetical protein